MQAAGGHASQPFAIFRDKPHDFFLPFVRRGPQRRLAPHLGAVSLNRKRKVQHAHLLLGERWRRLVLASRHFAGYGHLTRGLGLKE